MRTLYISIIVLMFTNTFLAQPIQEKQKLLASDGNITNFFGNSVSIFENIAVIGAPGNKSSKGAAYVFYKVDGKWIEKIKLTASDGVSNDEFGISVSINGNYIIIGSYKDDDKGENSGSAYIFQKDTTKEYKWSLVKKILASDGASGDKFGYDVSIYQDYVIVGAPYNDSNNGVDAGAAYIYYKNMGGQNKWGEVKKVVASDGAVQDNFGISVNINNGIAIVGAPYNDDKGDSSGSAYIYEKDQGGSSNWGQAKKIVEASGAQLDEFGYSVNITHDIAVVGAINADNNGAAYVYYRNRGGINNWGLRKKLFYETNNLYDMFGYSVNISGNFIVIGSPRYREIQQSDIGAAYIFEKDKEGTDNWGLVKQLKASDAFTQDWFGNSVSLYGNQAIIGSLNNREITVFAGAAYIYGPQSPLITMQPIHNYDVCNGSTITISIAGENIDTFQWQVYYVFGSQTWDNITDDSHFSGSRTSTLTVKVDTNVQNTIYRCIVSNVNESIKSDEAEVTPEDQPPVISSMHPDQTLVANSSCTAILPDYTTSMEVIDNCVNPVILYQDPYPGKTISGVDNKVDLIAIDDIGNMAMVSFNVAVQDTTPPLIKCVESKTIDLESGKSNYKVGGTEFDPLLTNDNCEIASVVNDFNNLSTLDGTIFEIGIKSIVWSVFDNSGNADSCSLEVSIKNNVGLEEIDDPILQIFPNPSHDEVSIIADQKMTCISIFDSTGQNVYSDNNIESSNYKMKVHLYSKGLYLIHIRTDKGIYMKKLILD